MVWKTYTRTQTCATSLATATLTAPLLSSATLEGWRTYGAVITYEDDTMVVDSFNDGTYSYRYTVDKRTWLQTGLRIVDYTGYTTYWARFVYDEWDVLRMIALNGDTTMHSGGIVFHTVKINGELGTRPGRPLARGSIPVSAAQAAVVSLLPGRHPLAGQVYVDLTGRLRFGRAGRTGPELPAGAYLVVEPSARP